MPGPGARSLQAFLVPALAAAVLLIAPGCSPPTSAVSPASRPAALDPDVAISTATVERMDDARLRHLLEASDRWRASRGPTRAVVDQVVLAADPPAYFAALATWSEQAFHPVLIDDPAWTLAFVRAFRPSRIVRFEARTPQGRSVPYDEWLAAETAVRRSWCPEDSSIHDLPPSGSPPKKLGKTPPGLVLSHPGSPTLAGAAALAAGRFQPLVPVEPSAVGDAAGKPSEEVGFKSVPSQERAVNFARRIETRVASVVRDYDKLGDGVDFLTLAGDWPYRYWTSGRGVVAGERAMDDLVGRVLPDDPDVLDSARVRWAFTGRLIGDPAASAYRAMCSLFLQPTSCLLWNTYGGGLPWSDYAVNGAAVILRLVRPDPGAVSDHSGPDADLQAWHREFRPTRRQGLLMMNTSGGTEDFSIAGGAGFSADIPFGPPTVVSMIHSFSAADPTDPATIAGRFLERGAFVYFGSMNEPYLGAFRAPYLVSQFIAAGLPLGAALRHGPYEASGYPWRLVYLGDPLYQIEHDASTTPPGRAAPRPMPPAGHEVVLAPQPRPSADDPVAMIDWCYDSALLGLSAGLPEGGAVQPADVLAALAGVDRERLDPVRRARFDALLIDQSLALGDVQGLFDRLWRLPARSRTPQVWHAIEWTTMTLVAQRLDEAEFSDVLDLWHRVVVGPWPPDSAFPGRLTQRVGSAAETDAPNRLAPFRRRLVEARDQLASLRILPERREMLKHHLDRIDRRLTGGN